MSDEPECPMCAGTGEIASVEHGDVPCPTCCHQEHLALQAECATWKAHAEREKRNKIETIQQLEKVEAHNRTLTAALEKACKWASRNGHRWAADIARVALNSEPSK